MKKIYTVAACLIGALIVTGCGDVTSLGTSVNSVEEDGNNISGNAAAQMQYITDDSTAEDYHALAEQYAGLGMIRRQRDILEQSYRLFGLEDTLEELSGIYVSLDEEDTEIQNIADLMLRNMELEEYRPESLHLVEENDWFATMMPKLYEGRRNYFKQVEGEVKMVVTVGYDSDGIPFSNVWYYGDENKVIYLGYDNMAASMMETMIANGVYEGEFILWTLDGITGDIMRETGSFSGGALQTDNYAIELHEGFGESDIYDLWNNRENMEYTALDGYGGAPGKSRLSEIPANPAFTAYEPVGEDAFTYDNPQIRVFDGEIQWLSDNGWITIGTVDEYVQSDPFLEYAAAKKEFDEDIKNAQAVQNTPEPEVEPETTPTPEVTQKPAATQKPAVTQKPATTQKPAATQKPATTQKPAATTKPTETPQPTPVPPDDDDSESDDSGNSDNDSGNGGSDDGGSSDNDSGNDGSDDGGSSDDDSDNGGSGDNGSDNNGGDNGGGSDSGGDGGSDSGSDGGGDVDIEWTDDIL